MSRRNVDLGSGSVGKLLFSLAVPTITSQIVNMLYNLVDRVYIGHMQPVETVGKLALTGVGVCLPIIMVISAFAALMAFGGAPRASIAEGRGDLKESERIMGNSFTMLVAVSVVLTVVFLVFAEPMLRIFGASDNTIGYALNYMRIYALGTIFVQVTLGMNAYITAQGFTVVGMKTVLIGAILNTVLDPIFIFAFGMGVRGAALATILSQAVSAVWVLKFLTGSKTKWHLRREHLRPQAKVVLPALALGASPFIMQSTESLITVCFNSSLLKYGGDIAVGAMTVLSSIMQFAMMPLQGLTQGAQPIISYNYGARNPERVRRAFQVLLMACLAYSLLLWALVQLFPQLFALMFTSDSELVSYASWALRIYMAATGIFGIQIACQQTFVALGNAKISLFLAVLRKIILLIPFIYILPNFFADKAFAVFLAEPVADFLAVCTTATMFSYNYGARNPERVRRAFQVLLMACLAYSLLLWALVQLFPQLFALMFTSDSELVSYASWALRIYMAATGIFGIQIACQQTFVALGNAKISLFLAVLRKIILLIPFIYILPNFFADKAFAVFLAEPVADFLAVCTTATMFAVHFKKSMTALEGKPGV